MEPVVYGLTRNLNSWDPLTANTHHFSFMRSLARKLPGLHKLRVIWNAPGWNPLLPGGYKLPKKTPGLLCSARPAHHLSFSL